MSKFLIEVSHGDSKLECLRAVSVFLNSGSHFLSHADWGCLDGEHKAWFFADVESKEDALQIVPPIYRKDAKVTRLNGFRLKEVEEMLKHHHNA